MLDQLGDVLRAFSAEGDDPVNNATKVVMNTPDNLLKAYKSYKKKHTFKAGQLVRWKEGMQNRKHPTGNTPAIVIEVFDTPIEDTGEDFGSAYRAEKLDVILGTMTLPNKEACFTLFYGTSNRFEPYKSAETGGTATNDNQT